MDPNPKKCGSDSEENEFGSTAQNTGGTGTVYIPVPVHVPVSKLQFIVLDPDLQFGLND
jgi:hypothetical protein